MSTAQLLSTKKHTWSTLTTRSGSVDLLCCRRGARLHQRSHRAINHRRFLPTTLAAAATPDAKRGEGHGEGDRDAALHIRLEQHAGSTAEEEAAAAAEITEAAGTDTPPSPPRAEDHYDLECFVSGFV